MKILAEFSVASFIRRIEAEAESWIARQEAQGEELTPELARRAVSEGLMAVVMRMDVETVGQRQDRVYLSLSE